MSYTRTLPFINKPIRKRVDNGFSPLGSAINTVVGFWNGLTEDVYEILFSSSNVNNENSLIKQGGSNGIDGTAYDSHVIDFNGTNALIQSNQITDIDYDDAFQIECWIKCDDTSVTGLIISNNDLVAVSSDDQKGFWLGIINSGKLSFNLVEDSSDDSERLTWSTPTDSVTQDKWTHILCNYDGLNSTDSCTISIDSVVQTLSNDKSGDISGGIVSTNNIYLGCYGTNQNSNFNGQIYEPSITINSTLTHKWEMTEGKELLAFDATSTPENPKPAGELVNATWVTSQSGFNYDPAISNALKNDAEVYSVWQTAGDSVTVPTSGTAAGYFGACTISFKCIIFTDSSKVLHSHGLAAYRLYLTGNVIGYNGFGSSGYEIPVNEIKTIETDFDADGKAIALRVDGVEEWAGSINGSSASEAIFYIGRSSTDTTFQDGIIWDFEITGADGFDFTGIGATPWIDQSGNGNNGTLNGTHLQQFPETGLKGNLTKKWNRALGMFISDGDNAIDIDNITLSGVFYMEFKVLFQSDSQIQRLTSGAIGDRFGCEGSADKYQMRINGANYTFTKTIPENKAETIRIERASNGELTVTDSLGSETISGTLDDFTIETLGRNGAYSWQGVYGSADINGQLFSYANNWQGGTPDSDVVLNYPIPEDPNNLVFDIFGDVITPSGDTLRADGLSHIDSNTPLTIDWDTAFELELVGVRFNELGSTAVLFENFNGAPTYRGLQVAKISADLIGVYLYNNVGSNYRVYFTSTSNISTNTSYNIKVNYNGLGTVAGFTLTINEVEETKINTVDTLGGRSTITTNNINIGRRRSTDGEKFNGSIEQIKFRYL